MIEDEEIGDLPSSQSGGELPGNHNGLSGGSGSQTLDTPPFVAFVRNFLGKLVALLSGKIFARTSLYPNTNFTALEQSTVSTLA